MSELKTTVNDKDVRSFLESFPEGQKRADSFELLEIFTRISGEPPKMWGSSIVGFGQYHYRSDKSRQEGDWPLTGFSPRKQALTLYFMLGFDAYAGLLDKLGTHKTSKGCLYINRLADVDRGVLEQLITESLAAMRHKYTP